MKPPAPPLFLRVAVFLGFFAALLGVAGFALLSPRTAPREDIRIDGTARGTFEVHLTWEDGGTAYRERLQPGAAPGRWRLPHGPLPEAATLVVLDRGVRPPREAGRAAWRPGMERVALDAP